MRIRIYEFVRSDTKRLWACDIDGLRLGVGSTPRDAMNDARRAIRLAWKLDKRAGLRLRRRDDALMYALLGKR